MCRVRSAYKIIADLQDVFVRCSTSPGLGVKFTPNEKQQLAAECSGLCANQVFLCPATSVYGALRFALLNAAVLLWHAMDGQDTSSGIGLSWVPRSCSRGLYCIVHLSRGATSGSRHCLVSFLTSLRCPCAVLFRQENVYGQKFIVDATLYCSLRAAGTSDRLEDSVSYADVFRFAMQHYQILLQIGHKSEVMP